MRESTSRSISPRSGSAAAAALLVILATASVPVHGPVACAAEIVETHGVGKAWVPEVRVTDSGYESSGGVGRKLGVDSTGRIHLVYTEHVGTSYRMLYAQSDDGGSVWTDGEDIAGNEENHLPAVGANLAIGPDDTVHVAWSDRRLGGNARIFYRRSFDRGDTWTDTPKDVSGATDAAPSSPSLSVDAQGRVHVAWHEGDPDAATPKARVYYTRSLDGGGEFLDPQPLGTDAGEHAAWPRFTVDGASGDVVAVAWRDQRRNPDWDVYVAVSSDAGESFVEHAAIATDARDWDPEVLVDPSGTLHLTWTTFDVVGGAPPSVSYARSHDLGVSWEAQTVVSEARSKLSSWAADPWRGVLWLWWKDERDALPPPSDDVRADLAVKYSLDGGTTWSPLEFASDIGSLEAYFPGMAVGPDGRVHAMWSDSRGGAGIEEIFVRSRDTGAQSGDLRTSHSEVRFTHKVKVGKTRTRTLRIRNEGDDLLAGRVGSLSAPFEVVEGGEPFSLERGERHKVKIRIAPEAPGDWSDVLLVRSTDPDQPELSIEVSGTGR